MVTTDIEQRVHNKTTTTTFGMPHTVAPNESSFDRRLSCHATEYVLFFAYNKLLCCSSGTVPWLQNVFWSFRPAESYSGRCKTFLLPGGDCVLCLHSWPLYADNLWA